MLENGNKKATITVLYCCRRQYTLYPCSIVPETSQKLIRDYEGSLHAFARTESVALQPDPEENGLLVIVQVFPAYRIGF